MQHTNRWGKVECESWFHWLKWRFINLFRIYEFSVNCECGNKIRCTDGIKAYIYECAKCDRVYSGTKRRVFS